MKQNTNIMHETLEMYDHQLRINVFYWKFTYNWQVVSAIRYVRWMHHIVIAVLSLCQQLFTLHCTGMFCTLSSTSCTDHHHINTFSSNLQKSQQHMWIRRLTRWCVSCNKLHWYMWPWLKAFPKQNVCAFYTSLGRHMQCAHIYQWDKFW